MALYNWRMNENLYRIAGEMSEPELRENRERISARLGDAEPPVLRRWFSTESDWSMIERARSWIGTIPRERSPHRRGAAWLGVGW